MSKRTQMYYTITATIFAIVAIVHLIRAIYEWDAVMAGVVIPVWVSWAAVIIAGYLSIRGFSALRKK